MTPIILALYVFLTIAAMGSGLFVCFLLVLLCRVWWWDQTAWLNGMDGDEPKKPKRKWPIARNRA